MAKPPRARSLALVGTVTALVLVFTPAVAQADTLPGAPGCTVLPADNVWHAVVSNLPVDPNSATYIASIGADVPLHPDFGAGKYQGEPIGIPDPSSPRPSPSSRCRSPMPRRATPGPIDSPEAPHRGRCQSHR